MKLSIIIVNWNSKKLLSQCLASIEAYPPSCEFEVVVWDNNSSDDSMIKARESHPWVKFVAFSDNLGFGGGNNGADKHCTGEFLLFLNPDTRVHQNSLDMALAFVSGERGSAEIGVVGVNQEDVDGELAGACGHFASLPVLLLQNVQVVLVGLGLVGPAKWLSKVLGRPMMPLKNLVPLFSFDRVMKVDWVLGAFMLVKRDIAHRAGMFDTDFFLYGEEVDFCKRVYDLGYSNYYLGDVKITHVGGGTTQSISAKSEAAHWVGAIKYYQKHNGAVQTSIYRLLLLGIHSMKVVRCYLKKSDKERKRAAKMSLNAVVWPRYDLIFPLSQDD